MRTLKAPIFLRVDSSTMYWINLYPLDYGPVHKLPATFRATFSVPATSQPPFFYFKQHFSSRATCFLVLIFVTHFSFIFMKQKLIFANHLKSNDQKVLPFYTLTILGARECFLGARRQARNEKRCKKKKTLWSNERQVRM